MAKDRRNKFESDPGKIMFPMSHLPQENRGFVTIQPISNPQKTYLRIWESSYGKANHLIILVKSQTTRPAQDMRFLIAISCLVLKHEWRVMNH